MTELPKNAPQSVVRRRRAAERLRHVAQLGTLFAFLGMIALFWILKPHVFGTPTNFWNILDQVSVLAMVAAVQTVVMVVGDFDLSVGSLASLVGVIVAKLLTGGTSPVVAILIGLSIGLLAGALNGFLVAVLGLSAFIATLATMTSFSGLALIVSQGSTIFGLPDGFVNLGQGRIGRIPITVIFALIVILLVWFFLSRTVIGRSWYAIGGNAEAARLSGVQTVRARFIAFVVSGLGTSAAGIILIARLASGHPTAGDPMMLTSIAAVFLGMTLSRAGVPTIGGTVVGLGILGVLSNGLNMIDVSSYAQQVLTGVIIIVAVSLSRLTKQRG